MVLGKLPVPGRPAILITVGQGPTALAIGAGGDCLDIFSLLYPFSPLSPSLWETARYRLKHCLKGPLNPNQSINQSQICHNIKNEQGLPYLFGYKTGSSLFRMTNSKQGCKIFFLLTRPVGLVGGKKHSPLLPFHWP